MNERLNSALEAIAEHDRQTGTEIEDTALRILEALAVYGDPERRETDEAKLACNVAELCELTARCSDPKLVDSVYCYMMNLLVRKRREKEKSEAEQALMQTYIQQKSIEFLDNGTADCKAEAVTMACADYAELRKKLVK